MSIRAFTPTDALPPRPGAVIELDDEESRYLTRVRRARIGELIELFDGRGGAWTATLRRVERRAQVEVGPALMVHEPADRVVLLGLPDQAATLEALTGASELGATQVVLVACERSQGRVPSAARIERTLRAAQRQCGRPRPPTLLGAPPEVPLGLGSALDHRSDLPGAFAWEALRDISPPPPTPADSMPELGPELSPELDPELGSKLADPGWRLLVGPEGGLTAAEAEAVSAAGFRAVGLGPWVLRTPTAVIAMLARFQTSAAWPREHLREG